MGAGLWPSREPVSHTERWSDQAKGGSAHGACARISMLTAGLELCGLSERWSPLAPLTSAVLSLNHWPLHTQRDYVKRRLCTCLFTSFHVLKIDANQLTHMKHSTCSKLSFFSFLIIFVNNNSILSNNCFFPPLTQCTSFCIIRKIKNNCLVVQTCSTW